MERKYRLKKDLPELKAGAIFRFKSIVYGYQYISPGGTIFEYFTYPVRLVEKNPDWFEKVKGNEKNEKML